MGDAALENGVLGVVIIEVHGVAVRGDLGEELDVTVGDFLAQIAQHADFEIFDADGAAREIVEHGHVSG